MHVKLNAHDSQHQLLIWALVPTSCFVVDQIVQQQFPELYSQRRREFHELLLQGQHEYFQAH
jgi:hypothetical protein